MSESDEFYKRALPRGVQIVIEREGDAWIGALYDGRRCVRWHGNDPERAMWSWQGYGWRRFVRTPRRGGEVRCD